MALACYVQAQAVRVNDLPVKVRAAFNQKFSTGTDWSWTVIDANTYSASFDINDMNHYAEVDSTGNILVLMKDVRESELPAAITSMLKKDFPAHKIEEAEYIERKGVITYEIEIEGRPDYEFLFDAKGKVLEKKVD